MVDDAATHAHRGQYRGSKLEKGRHYRIEFTAEIGLDHEFTAEIGLDPRLRRANNTLYRRCRLLRPLAAPLLYQTSQ